jgi:hypothetical protein
MYRVLTKITFVQQPTADFPARKGTIVYNFCHEFDFQSSWQNLTDAGAITLPKNVYIKDKTGNRYSLGGTNVNIGGFSETVPTFLLGDKVTIMWGYAYYDQQGNEVSPMQTIFEGYISGVTSKKPFVLEIQDNMYILKTHQASGGNNGFFSESKYTVETMLEEMIKNAGLPFTVNKQASTSIGDFISKNETIAEVLARLRKDFHFEAYFRGNELRCGSFKYIEQDALDSGKKVFRFQQNIISDSLEYKRRDDTILSAVASNIFEEDTGQTTKDGQPKTKKKRLEVLVTFRGSGEKPTVIVGSKETPLPPNTGGERRTLHFLGAKTTDELAKLAENELRKYYYTGFKGKFLTFGAPYIRHGDNVDILDAVLPERNGRYKVKAVQYTGGVNGLRQEIELDYLITRLDAKGNPIQ